MLRSLLPILALMLATPAGRGADSELDAAARQIVERINQFRKDQKRPPVTVNPQLAATARHFAAWMAATDFYGHEADGRQPWDRAKARGYDYCEVAENIAYAWRTNGFSNDELVTQFIDGWKKSPGHRKNMLDPDVTETGVAIARSADTGLYYAVQLFGRPKSLRIQFRVTNRAGAAVKYKVADKTYELPPRVVMTHELCRPSEVTLLAADGSTVAMTRPANGDKFAVMAGGDGGLKLLKD